MFSRPVKGRADHPAREEIGNVLDLEGALHGIGSGPGVGPMGGL